MPAKQHGTAYLYGIPETPLEQATILSIRYSHQKENVDVVPDQKGRRASLRADDQTDAVELSRRFQQPTGLEPTDIVRLILPERAIVDEVRLNGTRLLPASQPLWRLPLQPGMNQIVIRTRARPGAGWNDWSEPVALEIHDESCESLSP